MRARTVACIVSSYALRENIGVRLTDLGERIAAAESVALDEWILVSLRRKALSRCRGLRAR